MNLFITVNFQNLTDPSAYQQTSYVGTNDTFWESGTPVQLLAKYGLDFGHIAAAAEKVIARKNK
jgi:hypothetical protein